MKLLAALLALSISTGAMAHAIQLNPSEISTLGTLASSVDSSDQTSGRKYKAKAIINDSQEAMQSGKISVFLAQQIKEVQAENADVSVLEAIEILVSESVEVLN